MWSVFSAKLKPKCPPPKARVEKWVVENVVGSWDQRKDVENGEDDKMYEMCYGARRGISKSFIFYKELH